MTDPDTDVAKPEAEAPLKTVRNELNAALNLASPATDACMASNGLFGVGVAVSAMVFGWTSWWVAALMLFLAPFAMIFAAAFISAMFNDFARPSIANLAATSVSLAGGAGLCLVLFDDPFAWILAANAGLLFVPFWLHNLRNQERKRAALPIDAALGEAFRKLPEDLDLRVQTLLAEAYRQLLSIQSTYKGDVQSALVAETDVAVSAAAAFGSLVRRAPAVSQLVRPDGDDQSLGTAARQALQRFEDDVRQLTHMATVLLSYSATRDSAIIDELREQLEFVELVGQAEDELDEELARG